MTSDDDAYDDNDDDETSEIADESITSEDESTHMEESSSRHEATHQTDQQKADALKQQIALWDSFLELRIKLQRATITCNCLPTSAVADDEELCEVVDENAMLFRKTLALLLAIENRRSSKRARDENEENHVNGTNSAETTDRFKTISKRLKHDEQAIDDELSTAYERFAPERDAVVQKWFERAHGFAKQSRTVAAEQSPIVQIKEIMSFPDRLLKRTQTSRIDYDLVCPPSSPNATDASADQTTARVHPELFDDGDFYHQLLREYIERKTASITDPEQISKHWAQLRKLRSKLKKNLDTKASKDRKIRYNVHKKLVGYMAPTDRSLFTDDAKSDLFSSLFGKHQLATSDPQEIAPVNDIRII